MQNAEMDHDEYELTKWRLLPEADGNDSHDRVTPRTVVIVRDPRDMGTITPTANAFGLTVCPHGNLVPGRACLPSPVFRVPFAARR